MIKIIKSIVNYLNEVNREIKKVSWPDKAKVRDNTQVVIIFSAIFGAIIFGIDYSLQEIIKFMVK